MNKQTLTARFIRNPIILSTEQIMELYIDGRIELDSQWIKDGNQYTKKES
jgi:hypothetical protein